MKLDHIKKLKKYLFFISVFFFTLSLIHLSYSYIAANSTSKPVTGGHIAEGIVGDFPSLNPLQIQKGNNKYIMGLLYRSLLKYDIEQGKIVGDITKCDISTLVNIECSINEDAKWSNGENITAEDIVATYNIIEETNSNPNIVSLLDGVRIEAKDNLIVFKNKKRDVNFLNIFFQPIVNKEIINKLSSANINGSFPYSNGIYSGDYVIRDVSSDENIGVSKITFKKNEHYGNANISKITLFVFPDENALEKNKQAITVFNDKNNILGNSVARLGEHRYSLSQFVSLFINTEKIEHKNLRATILNTIDRTNLTKVLGEKNNTPVLNPYFTDENMDTKPANENFEAVMGSLGYKKKAQLIKELGEKNNKKNQKEEQKNNENNTQEVEKNTLPPRDEVELARYQKDSEFIQSPTYVDIYNFVSKDNILLKGVGTKGTVDEVYINDYKLKDFSKKDDNFFYRLSEDLGTIKQGKNIYKIYFIAQGEKQLKEEIVFYYDSDKSTLKQKEKELVDELYAVEQNKIKTENKPEVEVISSTEKTENISKNDNINKQELQKLEALDDKMYYASDLSPYTISLVYLNARKDFEETATFIKESLREIGVEVKLNALDGKSFITTMQENNYDMILGGIDTGFFPFNIFPYFHSGQAEKGFNYGNLRRTSLDVLLEDLKQNIYNLEKTQELEKQVIKIFGEEQFFKTLYSPKYNLLIDKGIYFNQEFSRLPDSALRFEVVKKLYMQQATDLSLDGKSIGGFIQYLGKKLYE